MHIEQSAQQLRKNYIWNTLASASCALASAVLMLVSTRILGVYAAGLFSFAFALSQQFLVLGHFEIRSFQATDARERFSFSVYLAARYVSCCVMLVGILGYCLYTYGLSWESATIALIALLKLFDAFEDVFHGMFQQRGRLDIAARALFFRNVAQVVGFCIAAFVTRDLLLSCAVSFVTSLIAFVFGNIPFAKHYTQLVPCFDWRRIGALFWACLPLFIGSFLLVYITNAPKYAIDIYLTREDQALYSILFMPSLVINLLSGFVFKPLLTDMALCFSKHDIARFRSIIAKGFIAVCAATGVTLVLAWFLGIPVLEALYGVSLTGYVPELMLLLVGGLFNALGVILYYSIVTMRAQRAIFVAYGISACAAYFLQAIVGAWGLRGAVVIYDLAMAIVACVFLVIVIFLFAKHARSAQTSASRS